MISTLSELFQGNQSLFDALNQIKEKSYITPYLAQGKKVIAIGFKFSSPDKAIDQWKEEVVK